jgi:hypothetical protein
MGYGTNDLILFGWLSSEKQPSFIEGVAFRQEIPGAVREERFRAFRIEFLKNGSGANGEIELVNFMLENPPKVLFSNIRIVKF